MSMWAYFSGLKYKGKYLKRLYEPQRASEILYMTVIRNMHFVGISMEGGETLKISELQSVCKYDDGVMEELKQCHPKQIISEDISIPIWKVE